MQHPNYNQVGSILIESIVAISLFGLVLSLFGASYTIITSNQLLKNKTLTYNLASEELEALRNVSFTTLTNRINSDFIEVAYNRGTWSIQQSGSAPSGTNVYNLTPPTGSPSGITGIAVVPGYSYGDFTFETEIKVLSNSPSGWKAGTAFRYHDSNNYYAVHFSATNLYIVEVVEGVESTLNSKAMIFSQNTWYALKIVTLSNAFEVYIDDVLELSTSDTDSSFSNGKLALYGQNSVHAQFDSVSITDPVSKLWNFDSDTVGKIASQWQRLNISDLPSGTGTVTIENSEAGFDTIKEVTARIEWIERDKNRAVELKPLITL